MNLYNRYRPRKIAEVVGHDLEKKIIVNSIKKNLIFPSYLFTGRSGTGKTTLARILGKAINCLDFKEDLCGICNSCRDDSTISFLEINCSINRGIDEIRKLILVKNQFPLYRKNIFLLDECHMLTEEAVNALLKVLEEVLKSSIFIFLTNEIDALPSTFLSRSLIFNLAPLTKEESTHEVERICQLENIKIDREIIEFLYSASKGNLRQIINIVEKGMIFLKDKDQNNFKKMINFFPRVLIEEIDLAINKKEKEKVLDFLSIFRKDLLPLSLFLSLYKDYLLEQKSSLQNFDKISLIAEVSMKLHNNALVEIELLYFFLSSIFKIENPKI